MYERLTALIPALQSDFDDTMLHHLIEEIHRFVVEHEDFGLIGYQEILKENGMMNKRGTVDVSHLDGKVVMALLVYAYREDRWVSYDHGVLFEYCRGGYIIRWLNRLKEIDET